MDELCIILKLGVEVCACGEMLLRKRFLSMLLLFLYWQYLSSFFNSDEDISSPVTQSKTLFFFSEPDDLWLNIRKQENILLVLLFWHCVSSENSACDLENLSDFYFKLYEMDLHWSFLHYNIIFCSVTYFFHFQILVQKVFIYKSSNSE